MRSFKISLLKVLLKIIVSHTTTKTSQQNIVVQRKNKPL